MFHDEIEILELRLDYLYDYVDYFVICEAKVSHSRKLVKDEYNYKKNINLYSKYADKIIFLPLEDFPGNYFDKAVDENGKPAIWENENYQRMYLYNGIISANDNDIIMISDVDEIPFHESIKNAKEQLINNNCSIICIKHKLFYYYFNLQKSQIWNGTVIFKKGELHNEHYHRLLNPTIINSIDILDKSIGILNGNTKFQFDNELVIDRYFCYNS